MYVPLTKPFSARCRSTRVLLLLLPLLIALAGCAGRLNRASEQFYAGQPEQALKTLEKSDLLNSRNKLLFLLERGVILHQLGRYRESIDQLLDAARLIADFDLISVSEQTSALVATEWLTRYKGEYSERLWVHSYLMMDYLLLGEYEDALVEAKQALKELEAEPESLNGDFFSRALIALCFAHLDEDNDALLVYRQLAQDLPTPDPVAADLVKHAGRMGMIDLVEKYRPYVSPGLTDTDAELVLFLATGRLPGKQPGNLVLPPSIRYSFPYYPDHSVPLPRLEVTPALKTEPLALSTDLIRVARDALDARKVQLLTKELARVVIKETTAQQIGQKSGDLAEALARVGLFLLEEPDTRSWQTLPARLTLVRIPLSAGSHQLRLRLSGYGGFSPGWIDLPQIELRPGQRYFYSLRF